MARPRSFDEDAAVRAAAGVFAAQGYEGAGVEDLVRALGVARASLYATFGSKRALYLRVLDEHVRALPAGDASLPAGDPALPGTDLTLLLRAAVERAPVDPEAAVLVRAGFDRLRAGTADLAGLLGRHLIATATTSTPREAP